jgi:hypothetical protein
LPLVKDAPVQPTRAGRRRPRDRSVTGHRLPVAKLALLGTVLGCLLVFVAIALSRDLEVSRRATGQSAPRPVVSTPRPALTPAEESYAQRLWPIHNDVKSSALKLSVAGMQYKIGGADLATVKRQAEQSSQVYDSAERQVRELQPPSSLQAQHDEYLQAVRLYRQSAAVLLHVEARRDDALLEAFPMSQQGGQILRRVGAVLWPGEYVPS